MSVHKDVIQNIEQAPAGPQIGAFFDFDGTLIAGFSATVFLKEQIRRGDISPQEFLEVLSAVAQFSLGGLGFSGLMTTAARFMRGVREADYIAFGEELYEQQIARRVYPESRALVQAHMDKGHTVAIISSATPYQVEPVARDLGFEHVICSRYEVEDGVFTGGIVRPLCFGDGKVQAAEELADTYGIDLDQSFFYSDSHDDLQLLERVGHPQPLNPNSRLTEIAERQGWPIRRFRSRGQPGLFDYVRSLAATASLVPSAMAALPIWALTGSQREGRNFATSVFADVSSALIGLNLVVRGEQHLWSHRPAVFVFNHQSKADVIIMARLLRRDFAGVAKKEIKNNPLIGKTLEFAGTVFIDRENSESAISAIQPLVDAMRNEGRSVLIAPEGTRTVSPRLGPFKKGAFHLAVQAGVPMVPVVIHNAGDVAPKGEFVLRPATVEVDVLPPVDTSGWRSETIEEHVAEVRRMFQETLGQEGDRESVPMPRPPAPGSFLPEAVPVKTSSAEEAGGGGAAAEPEKAAAPALKKAARKKTPPKKVPRKKVSTKKASARKSAAKKSPAKKATRKKAPAKKAAAKKAVSKKAPQKKVTRKKAAAKKAASKKAPVKKAAAKKALVKKARRKKPSKKAAPAAGASSGSKPRKPPRPKPARKKVLTKKPEGGAGG
jgi:putative phosphoserine phosphatase/1-acylglycerol-3-phosphate O-acyltransferase